MNDTAPTPEDAGANDQVKAPQNAESPAEGNEAGGADEAGTTVPHAAPESGHPKPVG